jgi:hypothetical protein
LGTFSNAHWAPDSFTREAICCNISIIVGRDAVEGGLS